MQIYQIYIWRHSKEFSSWSMLDEPHIHRGGYMEAEVVVLAESREDALTLLAQDGSWHVEELERIEPQVLTLDNTKIISKHVR
ncbi:MAG: hypothetical protein GX087_03830 [Desulfobulbaceae bacterium]|nr:hypothetical protein [Desulfobulbaceae bacterium]